MKESNYSKAYYDPNQNVYIKEYLETPKAQAHKNLELDFYAHFSESPYLPRLIEVNNNMLKIEYLSPSIKEYAEKNGHYPYDFPAQHFAMLMSFLDEGFYSGGDEWKEDHLFYINGQLKMIDYGTFEYTSRPEVHKEALTKEYSFLFDSNDKESLDSYFNQLTRFFSNIEMIEDLKKNFYTMNSLNQ